MTTTNIQTHHVTAGTGVVALLATLGAAITGHLSVGEAVAGMASGGGLAGISAAVAKFGKDTPELARLDDVADSVAERLKTEFPALGVDVHQFVSDSLTAFGAEVTSHVHGLEDQVGTLVASHQGLPAEIASSVGQELDSALAAVPAPEHADLDTVLDEIRGKLGSVVNPSLLEEVIADAKTKAAATPAVATVPTATPVTPLPVPPAPQPVAAAVADPGANGSVI
jgi:hypothetical protein